MAIGTHLVLTAYGFWLPNDPRGSWSDFVGSWELYRLGRATTADSTVSVAHVPHDEAARLAAKQALRYPPVHFTGVQARAVGRGFARFVERTRLTVWACAILPEHAHLVIAAHHYTVDQIANLLKGEATRQLVREDIHPLAAHRTRTGHVPKAWGRGFWRVFLDTEEDVRRAVRYVEESPVREGKGAQHWGFVEGFGG